MIKQQQRLAYLTEVLQRKVPQAQLKKLVLPQCPEISLWLIEDTYPQHCLTAEQVDDLMDSPPYWAFCWASGQVLARFLADNPQVVAGKTVVDFGSGSGVGAVAAAKAGAKRVIALDIDEAALVACEANSELNGVIVEAVSVLPDSIARDQCVLLVADVFYDRDNLPLVSDFLDEYAEVIVADSRVKPEELQGLREQALLSSTTIPDLAESSCFNSVRIYQQI